MRSSIPLSLSVRLSSRLLKRLWMFRGNRQEFIQMKLTMLYDFSWFFSMPNFQSFSRSRQTLVERDSMWGPPSATEWCNILRVYTSYYFDKKSSFSNIKSHLLKATKTDLSLLIESVNADISLTTSVLMFSFLFTGITLNGTIRKT